MYTISLQKLSRMLSMLLIPLGLSIYSVTCSSWTKSHANLFTYVTSVFYIFSDGGKDIEMMPNILFALFIEIVLFLV